MGPGTSKGQSYIMPMMSHDIISTIEGVGCVTEGGSVMGNSNLTAFM